jgi:ATP-dependent protease ClpP protease subunit
LNRKNKNKKHNDDDDLDDLDLEDLGISIGNGDKDDALYNAGISFLWGTISADSVAPVVHYVVSENLKQRFDRLTIVINSAGGDLHAAFTLIPLIETSTIPVTVLALGECASAALMIAMSCAKGHRIIDRNCSVLSHQYSASMPGMTKHTDIKARHRDFLMTEGKIIDHYMRHTGRTKQYIKKYLLKEHDVFMEHSAAIKHGLFDDVLDKRTEVLYHTVFAEWEAKAKESPETKKEK